MFSPYKIEMLNVIRIPSNNIEQLLWKNLKYDIKDKLKDIDLNNLLNNIQFFIFCKVKNNIQFNINDILWNNIIVNIKNNIKIDSISFKVKSSVLNSLTSY